MSFKVGWKINITGLQTTIPLKGVTIVESNEHGIIVIREGVKSANPEFYPWGQIQKIELLSEPAPMPADDKKGKPRAPTGN